MALHDLRAAEVEVYPVGVLSNIQHFVHNPDRKQARTRARYDIRRLTELVRERQWRALRQSFNGYLAEHATRGTRCGHGWTRGRALRSLARHLADLDARRDGGPS